MSDRIKRNSVRLFALDQTGVEDMPSMTIDEAMSIVAEFTNGPGGDMVIESNDQFPAEVFDALQMLRANNGQSSL